ncbi:MAG TPA: hypothetical protein VNK24_01420 [Elusimicrobiota bacterium]|nr:hypothetical protein [Elusimicrobiota bacterium]
MRFQGGRFLLFCAIVLPAWAHCRAHAAPSLGDQRAWTRQDKATFLRYLNSKQPMQTGQVRQVYLSENRTAPSHAAWSLELGPASTTLFPFSEKGGESTARGTLGVRALYERHLTPWLRAYAGLEAESLRQNRTDGSTAELMRWSVPAGIEFALVPLATPQTRYVLLRVGLAASQVSGAPGSDFSSPAVGTSAAWDIGLGYEWQIPNSSWRVNAAVDGLRSMGDRNGVGYYGLGSTLALVRTF